ncbi:MAG TPA: Na+ dependent nucleoside transporter N-terminal domain-containing protein, partial [Ureibacillus sp.]|nr:Na+ dependent nucleoside transporter N-terminal domain-containing protein [Ureibacillus sp.]
MNIIWGILGIFVVLLIAFVFSSNRKAINWRTIAGGLAIQLIFAFIVLKWELGREVLLEISNAVQKMIGYANEGISFLFGPLANPDFTGSMVFALSVLTIIIFFSSLISVLYYLRIMQFVIKILGGGLSKLLGTSKAESVNAAANIFV